MRVGIVVAFVDYHRRGAHHRGVLQPQVGPLLAALLPDWAEVEVVNDTWEDPDWSKSYDFLIVSAMHSDFDRARQIAHYWHRRGAKTVIGGTFARLYPQLCAPFFDAVVVGDPEDTVPRMFADFVKGELKPYYASAGYRADSVPTPRFDLTADVQWLPLGLEATRGCPFGCEFCVLTGIGTRFETRPPQRVVGDLRAGIEQLRSWKFFLRRDIAIFYDNNLAGDFTWLHELCIALEPLNIRWGCSLTFNAASNRRLVKAMAKAGCGFMYVGIESFNPKTLAAMNKQHNVVRKTRDLVTLAHDHGILVTAGLMISAWTDDVAYIRSIPAHLEECRLDVPTYICFETPIPGTPFFNSAARSVGPVFFPNVLLRDFSTYTLVLRPHHASPENFIDAYRATLTDVYSASNRLKKVLRDARSLIPAGGWKPLITDAIDQWTTDLRPDPGRSYIAGSDRPPPEADRVPLAQSDFADEREWHSIMDPMRVTDAEGRLYPEWRSGVSKAA